MAGCQILCDGTELAPTNYLAGLSDLPIKKGLFSGFALIKNDVVISDPSDLAAWQSAAAVAGQIECGPCAVVDLGTPTFNTDTDECGNDEIDETVFGVTFTFKRIDGVGLSHVKYFKDLMKAYRCYNIIIFDCEGWPVLTDEYCEYLFDNTLPAPTGSPGYAFSLTQSPTVGVGANNKEQWTMGIQIKTTGTSFLAQAPLTGLFEAICS